MFVCLRNGGRWVVEGTAKVMEPKEPAKLGVQFTSCKYPSYQLLL